MDIGLRECRNHSVTWISKPSMWTTTTVDLQKLCLAGDETDFKSVDLVSAPDLNNIVQIASLP